MAPNPNIPTVASSGAIPPSLNIPWGRLDKDGQTVWLSVPALQVLQALWASIGGQGGLQDLAVQLQNSGVAIGQIESRAIEIAAQEVRRAEPPWLSAVLALVDARRPSSLPLGPPISPSMVFWTPVVQGLTAPGTQTYATQWGGYAEVGPLSVALFNVALSAFDAATAGNIIITGLPQPARTSIGQPQGAWITGGAVSFGAGFTQLSASVIGSRFRLYVGGDGMPLTQLAAAGMTATSTFIGGAIYFH